MIVQSRIAKYLVDNDKKATAVADKAGIERSKFSRIISQKIELKADDLEKICKALDVMPSEFVNPETKKTSA